MSFADPARQVELGEIVGEVRFEDVEFAYTPEKPVLHGISFRADPGTVTALVGSSGSGKSTIISLVCAFHTPQQGAGAGGRCGPGDGGPEYLSLATGRGAAGVISVRRHDSRKHHVLAPGSKRRAVSVCLPHGVRGRVRGALSRRIRNHRGRARREALRRTAAAAVDCACAVGRAADSDSGRSDQLARFRVGSHDPERACAS